MTYDFDSIISRAGTYAEKYELREKKFGKADAEPFWLADMDLPAPRFVVDALRKRIEHPIFGYTAQYDSVTDSIVWWMRNEHDAEVDPSWISFAPSVVASISTAVRVLSNAGDSVAVLSPVYGPFFTYVDLHGRHIADCPLLVNENRFDIDFPLLNKTLERPEVTLLLLCNPQNPGGRVWSKTELVKIVECCAANNVLIFSDEIHSDFVYEPLKNISMLNIEGAEKIGVVAHSIGKTFNTSGLHASFTIIPDAELRGRFRAAAELAHSGDINLLGKVAIEAVFSPEGIEYKRQLLAYLRENTRLVVERLRDGGIAAMLPESTFLVWGDFREFGPWHEVHNRLLNEANVALSDGPFFGPAGTGWFRINCAYPRAVLLAAVDRIVATFKA